ncbi:MAG TPA: AAA family ATPase [Mycobacterium sp.]
MAEFLAGALTQPCALLVEGEAGIGKTTFMLTVLEEARQQNFLVLSTRCAAVETDLAYAALADMLHSVDPSAWATLPEPQRLAIDRILLRVTDDAVPTDQRAVTAGFVAVIESLAEQQPVLLAIDDLQWLDPSSAAVFAFATRRFSTPVGVLGTVRLDPDADGTSWLQASRPDLLQRIRLPPMALGEIHHVVTQRLGESFSRPAIVQIHEISGGNPFYAIELARAVDPEAMGTVKPLPRTLADVVQARLGSLDEGLQQVLLAAACSAKPTVELLSAVLDARPDEVARVLDEAEDKQILVLDGNRVRFSHPLLAHGVYADASASRRRQMHRRMALHIDEPEVRARHLALAAISGDSSTLESLDAAAEMARARGAPAAAAELVELAIGLGGDTPQRWISSATYHFNAGDAGRARTRLQDTIERSVPGRLRAEALRLLGVWSLLDGSSRDAAGLLERALSEAEGGLALLVQILVPLAFALINVGHFERAATSIEQAVEAATELEDEPLLSQALGMRVLVHFLLGHGFDETGLQRARELEDPHAVVSGLLSPTMQHAELLAGTGRLDEARKELLAIRQHHVDRGDESELTIIAFHRGLTDIWQGNFDDAALIADDAMERALQLDRDLPLAVALTMQAAVAAYTGDECDARRDANRSFDILRRCDSPALVAVWPLTTLGFLEVSLGRYDKALTVLEPLLRTVEQAPAATEIFVTPFLPDAIEASIALRRIDEATRLLDLLETNGRRLNRPWMVALGARCRAMSLAAVGQIDEAHQAVQLAMAAHERLPMPFERARTRLLLGQIQRRLRQKGVACTSLNGALDAFEALGVTRWADRARAEMSRVKIAQYGSGNLTAAERRVAELAASGLTNREVAAALFVSPKTVDTNLTRVYRKLGIHTRAQLGRRMGEFG